MDAVVGPTNLLLNSLFSQVDVFFNDKLISSSSNTYAYRAYLETLLNYGKAAKNHNLLLSCGTKILPTIWMKRALLMMEKTETGQ